MNLNFHFRNLNLNWKSWTDVVFADPNNAPKMVCVWFGVHPVVLLSNRDHTNYDGSFFSKMQLKICHLRSLHPGRRRWLGHICISLFCSLRFANFTSKSQILWLDWHWKRKFVRIVRCCRLSVVVWMHRLACGPLGAVRVLYEVVYYYVADTNCVVCLCYINFKIRFLTIIFKVRLKS